MAWWGGRKAVLLALGVLGSVTGELGRRSALGPDQPAER